MRSKDNSIPRSSGVLLPVFSLPSPYGIGTLGKAARDFVGFLAAAGQSWWQMLPIGPTGYGDSPYQSLSTYGGNPYFIDLDLLIEEGLLQPEEIKGISFGEDKARVDYGLLYQNRLPLLEKAAERGLGREEQALAEFEEANAHWLPDYALFMALKGRFSMACWLDWPEELRLREPRAMEAYRQMLFREIRLFTYIQFLFFRQWDALKDYAHKKGVGIIGDLPIYVALDSADVWAAPENFLLDEKGFPLVVAGVPPDYFSAEGQLWGNPIYDYQAMEAKGFDWWIRRVAGAARCYDGIRIDHFRGLESYWAVPYGQPNAIGGTWQKGPGMALLHVLKQRFPHTLFIAEDLGHPTKEAAQLLEDSGFPGMKVLAFAFDSDAANPYLPHNYQKNSVCYTGTHDNDTLKGWFEGMNEESRQFARGYLGLNQQEGELQGILRAGMSSVSDLFIAQLQDYLFLSGESRINVPGRGQGNWQWRLLPHQIPPHLAGELAQMTQTFDRAHPAFFGDR